MSGERFTVSILLNGEYKRIKFRIQEGVTYTVESVKNEVRSTFGVVNGTLSYSPHEIDVVVSLTAGDVYHFIGFQVPAQTDAPGQTVQPSAPGTAPGVQPQPVGRRFPPFRLSVLVLLSKPKSEYLRSKADDPDWFMIGTAVIVESVSKDILLTAGHCVYADDEKRYGKYEFACCASVTKSVKGAKDDDTSMAKKEEHENDNDDVQDGHFYEYEGLFPVEIVTAKDSPDIAVLRRVDGNQFVEDDMIKLCPPDDIPWLRNARDWEAEVMCFHCPITKFDTDQGYDKLECCISNWLQVAAKSNHHFWVEENFHGGSSGGAIVLGNSHTLIGILIHTVSYGEFELRQGLESVELWEELKKPIKSDFQNVEVVSLKGSVARSQCTSTVAVIPSLVQMMQNGSDCNLYQWLKSCDKLSKK